MNAFVILPVQNLFTPLLRLSSLCLLYCLTACNATLPTQEANISPQQAVSTENQQVSTTPVSTNTDLWQRIRNGYQLTGDIPKVGQQRMAPLLQRYQKHPHDIFQQTEQAGLYLFYIVQELEKHGMPTELALLPFVESRYDPFAYSSSRASGLWQFIPGTAKHFHLKENWWLDERRDIIASTQAAIRYFKYLYKYFDNDWLLAIAAYNAGEGTVGKAIKYNKKRGKPSDYWSLPLSKETQFYIPKLLAWSKIIQHPENYQLKLAKVDNAPIFTSVDIGSQIDLAKLANITDIDINQLYALNPAYNRWATDPDLPHHLLLPIHVANNIQQSLSQYPIKDRIRWIRYTIKPNDSLSVIAQKFNTTTSVIKNTNKLRHSTIRSGSTLLIPQASKNASFYQGSKEQRIAIRQNSSNRKNKQRIQYTVQAGDSLWGIARKHKVSASSIAYWNNMSVKDTLRKNQLLVIWGEQSSKSRASSVIRKVIYKVRKGDNLSSISNKFNVTINDIREWNKIKKQKYIKIGQTLRLFVSMANQASQY